jgi:predicted ribonuclease YlaK
MNFYDTCSILDLLEDDYKEKFVISSVSLTEIDNIKVSLNKSDDIKFKARQASRWLNKYINNYETVIVKQIHYNTLNQFQLPITNDNLICVSAWIYNKETESIIFHTRDNNCRIIASKIFELDVVYDEEINNNTIDYTGYKEICMSNDEMSYFYQHINDNLYSCLINEYLVIRNAESAIVDKRKWNGSTHEVVQFRQINNDFSGKIKPRNLQQELAFDMLQDTDSTIKVLSGIMGSGKDYLMISTALQLIKNQKYEKILWVRNNIEVKDSKQIGFLPSTKKDKLMPFAMILADHTGGVDGLELLITQRKIEIEHLGFIRGRDIKNTIIYCSESENMTTEHIQLLISRIGEGSVLWMNGDCKQIDSQIFETNNGFKTVINKLKGQPLFGYIKLKDCERSDTARLVDLLN